MYLCKDCGRQFQGGLRIDNTPVRDKFNMKIVLFALILLHILAVPPASSQKSNMP